MATAVDIARVEIVTGYHIRDTNLVVQALQAPRKIQDRETGTILLLDDGNRRLAQLGHKVLDLALTDMWYSAGSDRGTCLVLTGICSSTALTAAECVQDTIEKLAKNEYLANIAKRRGLDTCIICCERQSDNNPSPKTLKLGVTALIAAIWLDSERDLDTVRRVMRQLR